MPSLTYLVVTSDSLSCRAWILSLYRTWMAQMTGQSEEITSDTIEMIKEFGSLSEAILYGLSKRERSLDTKGTCC